MKSFNKDEISARFFFFQFFEVFLSIYWKSGYCLLPIWSVTQTWDIKCYSPLSELQGKLTQIMGKMAFRFGTVTNEEI